MNPFIIQIETANNGSFRERVLMIDKLMFEKAARANGWNLQTSEITFTAFCAWQVLKRLHKIPTELTYEQFIETELLDAVIIQEESAQNPTPTA
ncbi:hypothetical protein [Mobiluncus curtisii]|uniref:hypothetical protein n=1 Tax=Mobiluncus curtisii TaxID=2051 RepID=UPI00242EB88E|nr:hypothetical protein [Mobiluncus curtisii]